MIDPIVLGDERRNSSDRIDWGDPNATPVEVSGSAVRMPMDEVVIPNITRATKAAIRAIVWTTPGMWSAVLGRFLITESFEPLTFAYAPIGRIPGVSRGTVTRGKS